MKRDFEDLSREELLQQLDQELSWVELFLSFDGDGNWTTLRPLLERLEVL